MRTKKIAEVFKIITLYVLNIVLSTAVFIGLFHTPLFESVTVFFYRGVIFLFISMLFSILLMLLMKRLFYSIDLSVRDVVAVGLAFLGFTSTWFVLLPVTVERSISVFMLSYMDENDTHGVTTDEFQRIFFQKYIIDFGAFDKRFSEQLLSHNIKMSDDGSGYVITDAGRRIVNLFRLNVYLFNTEKWLVYPNEYEQKFDE